MSYPFQPRLLENKALERISENGNRYYVTPQTKKYISVTTALNVLSSKGIEEWRQRVGEEYADGFTKYRAKYGSELHNVCEKYLFGKDVSDMMPTILANFKPIKEILDNHVTTLYGIELPLYSDELRAAGTADLICLFDKKLTVLDFKSGSRPKKEEHIQNYFIQAGSYAVMVEELYNMEVEQIVILVSPDAPQPQLFIKDANLWKRRARNFFKLYHGGFFTK